MRITESRLRSIIKEEAFRALHESPNKHHVYLRAPVRESFGSRESLKDNITKALENFLAGHLDSGMSTEGACDEIKEIVDEFCEDKFYNMSDGGES
jgi:hypothetical protein